MKLFLDRSFRLPRIWSNSELRKIAPVMRGDVINVSGWQDLDKQGGRYKDYFINADRYFISNYSGFRGVQGSKAEINIDLTASLPDDLVNKFDVVFNHTTLEHILDVNLALKNLCLLSKDIVIVVVPVAQEQHESESWGDYWRFMPLSLRSLFTAFGLSVVYESVSKYRNAGVYLFMIASYHPEKWRRVLPSSEKISNAAENIGRTRLLDSVRILKSIYNKLFR